MDPSNTSEICLAAEEIIIEDALDSCGEVIIEECSIEVQCASDLQSTSAEPFLPLEVEQTIEVETPIEFAETVIKSELDDEELLIPAEECEVEIDPDINEFECIYIKENYLENMVQQEEGQPDVSDSESSSSSDNDNPRDFKCQLCGRLFTSKEILNSHMLRHASEKYFCVICDKTFKKKHNLDFHMSVHSTESSEVYNCSICSKSFANRANLSHHMMLHKNLTERVMCNICNKSFQKSYLKIHMGSHIATNEYTCTFCSKNLSSKQSLYMHMNTVHANEGCYECTYCEKRFFWKSYLDRHITVHTKEKSHHCLYCSKAFTRKLALRKHMSTHVVKGKYCLM